jgi:hypothetical protein
MRTPRCVWVADVDVVRVDLPGDGYQTTVLLNPEQAIALLTGLKVALADREPTRTRTPRKRP